MMLYSLLVLLVAVHTVNLLRITNFYVPRRATNQVEIDCKYDVEGEKLYDVKWYKDGQHFFRCSADGTVHEYPVEGVMIRHSGSASVGACPLTLIALTAKSAGEYKCEVTIDIPGFPMVYKLSRLDLLLPSKRTNDSEILAKGSEKQTSEEETKITSGCEKSFYINYITLLLMITYFILT